MALLLTLKFITCKGLQGKWNDTEALEILYHNCSATLCFEVANHEYWLI